jgi:5-deoxy-glucuronate isomerase
MTQYDALYVPRDSRLRVVPGGAGCDLAEISAPVTGQYPVQYVPFAEVRRDPNLHFAAGAPSCERDLNIVIGKNVQAGRILAGVTFSKPGNWTSWPPHEHAAILEEAYLYIAMPAPAWGLQLVYTDSTEPELVTVVREGDVVVMPEGYHPNVAAPGGCINFLWMMAAHEEGSGRQFGVVNVHPAYAGGGSGLEAANQTR